MQRLVWRWFGVLARSERERAHWQHKRSTAKPAIRLLAILMTLSLLSSPALAEPLRSRAGFVPRLSLPSGPDALSVLVTTSTSPTSYLRLSVDQGALQLHLAGIEHTKLKVLLSTPDSQTHWYRSPWVWAALSIVLIAGAATGALFATNHAPRAETASGGTSGVLIKAL